MSPEVQSILPIIQIVVGILTLGAIFFYAGRHSEKLNNHTDQIEELKTAKTNIYQHLNQHDVHIAILAQDHGIDLHHHNQL